MDHIHTSLETNNSERQIGLGGVPPQTAHTGSIAEAATQARHDGHPANAEPPPVITGPKRQLV